MDIVNKKVDELIPYVNNPRNNKNAVDKVASSIKNFGFKVPIVIDSKNEIITGHTRLLGAKKLKLEEVPCIVADDLSEEQIKAFRIADNKVAEYSEWNEDLLNIELAELKEMDIDLDITGFDDIDIDEMLGEEKEVEEDNFDVDDAIDDIKEPTAKRGQIYKLGEHRLMCGDSTSEEDVNALMNGEKAVLAHNDPPYGMKKEADGVTNDNLNYDDLLVFNKKWIDLQFKHLEDNGSWYCWGIDEPLMDIYSNILKPLIKKQKATFRNLITWNKGNGQGQLSEEFRSYPIADEKCLFVMCGVQGFNNNADNYFENWESIRVYLEGEIKKIGENDKTIANALGFKDGRTVNHWWSKSQWSFPTEENYNKLKAYANTKVNDAFKKEYDELKKEYDELKKEYYSTRAYFNNTHDNMNNVWNIARTTGEEKETAGGHATPKPLELCQRVIKSSSRENDLVIDMFGGSGSTLIASEQLGRRCNMMEYEPKWCDVIIRRWEEYTGKKAELIKG